MIRPLTSPGELARAFELIGARRAAALEQDRYFLQLARRFPEDQPLMLASIRSSIHRRGVRVPQGLRTGMPDDAA